VTLDPTGELGVTIGGAGRFYGWLAYASVR